MSTPNVVSIHRDSLASISPVTGELLREYEQQSDEMIDNKLQLAWRSFRKYCNVPFAERAQMMICAPQRHWRRVRTNSHDW
jgi:acyl-CoA reductase-like NAD-dependent aldehyde dehydrogenase